MMMNLPCLMASCANFLRPIYHTLNASQAPKRGMPHEKTAAGYSSCFYVWLILTCIHLSWYWFTQWTLYHYGLLLVFCRCSPFRTPSFTGFCSRTLSSLRCLPSVTRQSSGVCYLYIFVSYAAIGACASTGRLISFNCFCGSYVVPVFRIVWITLSILQAITTSDCIFFNGLLGRVV